MEGASLVAWVTSVGTEEALSHHLGGGQGESPSSLTGLCPAQLLAWMVFSTGL